MSIAVIGTGNIGGTLGRAFARDGLDVVFGSRNPADSTAAGDTKAGVATVAEAVAQADTVLVAIPAGQVEQLLRDNAGALSGKLIVDAANNFPGPVFNSAALVKEIVPGARYARAFNSQTWETFQTPAWDGVQGDLFFTALPEDQSRLEELINAVGLRPVYLGADQEDLLDATLRLFMPLMGKYGRHVGLRILAD
jgi:predicted dinucleotide-binding enzyme